MLEKEKAIDAILCATPDHVHAYVSTFAMRAGKHVYCEKPLTHNIWETRLVAKVAKETGVVTQMGNQGHSNDGIRQTCEWVWAGALGPVREVHAWVGARRWNPILTGRPKEPLSVEARPAGPVDPDIGPHGCIAYYHFGPRGDRPPVKIVWYDGGLGPERPDGLPEGEVLPSRGVLFIGDKGKLLCGGAGGRPRLL